MKSIILFSMIILILVLIPIQSLFSDEVFLRCDSGFEIHVKSTWKLDAKEAYLDAKRRLENGVKLYGVSADLLLTSTSLTERLQSKDRAYGRVYQMVFSGFVSDSTIEQIRKSEKRQSNARLRNKLVESVLSLILFAVSACLFIKTDRALLGDQRMALALVWLVGTFCTLALVVF